jgi:uncharacterized membrane protein YvlD (DUF360 family)
MIRAVTITKEKKMVFSLTRIVQAILIAVVVGLVCILLGGILVTLKVPIAVTVGGFMEEWGWVIGVVFGLWFYFGGGAFPKIGA